MVRSVQSFCKRVARVEDGFSIALEFSSSSARSTHDDHFIPSFTLPHEAMKPALSALDRVPALNTPENRMRDHSMTTEFPDPRTPNDKVSSQNYRKVVSRFAGPELLLLESHHTFCSRMLQPPEIIYKLVGELLSYIHEAHAFHDCLQPVFIHVPRVRHTRCWENQKYARKEIPGRFKVKWRPEEFESP
jgi:hypothetical protein